jgi:2'-5' RNA ligase
MTVSIWDRLFFMQTNSEIGLYFIALLPPEPYLSDVFHLKQEMAERFQSKASLNSPAHITLHMPFKFPEKKEQIILEAVSQVVERHSQFPICQRGFGAFEPRVIFVNVELSQQLRDLQKDVLSNMRRQCKIENSDYKNMGFHPHMTIAFRDLKKSVFSEAWTAFQHKEIEMNWQANEICLLKHDGKKWEVFKQLALNL